MKGLSIKLEAIALHLSASKSVADFVNLRTETYLNYARFYFAISGTLNADGPRRGVLSEVTEAAFSDYEKVFSSEGVTRLGKEASEEAVFCLSTLRRAYRLLDRIFTVAPPEQSAGEDKQYAKEFNGWMVWSQLHLDCLRVIFDRNVDVEPAIIPEILAGFRGAVMAYSFVRQGAELREHQLSQVVATPQWDQEDESLAEESTDERESTLSEW